MLLYSFRDLELEQKNMEKKTCLHNNIEPFVYIPNYFKQEWKTS